jgi:YegS/Rv2252/BmrU family lipid kinase
MTAFEKKERNMKYCFIINPKAGKGCFVEEAEKNIRTTCDEKSVDYDIYLSESVESTREYVARTAAAGEGVVFIACGGDGTVCKTVSAIMALPESDRERVALGIMPMGTGNDFVSNFENKELFFNVGAQIEAEPCKIDLFKCNDTYSINMVNVGFDSHVVCTKEKIGKKAWVPRKLAYIFSLVITLVRKPGVKMTFSTESGEEVRKDLLLATFANGSYCGGGFYSNPTASLWDGAIDCIAVKNMGRIRFLSLVGSYKKGTHLVPKFSKIIEHFKCREAHIKLDEQTPVSVDGEILPLKEIHISVVREALTVMIPSGASIKGLAPCRETVGVAQ